METMNAIDSTIWVNGCRATINALSARSGNPVESNRSNKEDWRSERPCDVLVVNCACPEHNSGICPWGHD